MPFAQVNLQERLSKQDILLGAFVFSTDPAIPEVYAAAGFDYVIVDMEHGLNDVATTAAHLRSSRGAGIAAIVRPGPATFAEMPRLLDAGCEGLLVPHYGLPGHGAEAMLRATRYHPEGTRPTCTGVAAAGYGTSEFGAYARRSNDEFLAVGLIEDRESVENIDEILDRGEVKWILPGPADLATSLGLHGMLRHPVVEGAIEKVIRSAQQRNIPVAVYIHDPFEIPRWRAIGIRIFCLTIDLKWLGLTLRNAAAASREQAAAVMRG